MCFISYFPLIAQKATERQLFVSFSGSLFALFSILNLGKKRCRPFRDDIRRKYHLKSCDTYFLLHCNSQASIRIKRDRYNPPRLYLTWEQIFNLQCKNSFSIKNKCRIIIIRHFYFSVNYFQKEKSDLFPNHFVSCLLFISMR